MAEGAWICRELGGRPGGNKEVRLGALFQVVLDCLKPDPDNARIYAGQHEHWAKRYAEQQKVKRLEEARAVSSKAAAACRAKAAEAEAKATLRMFRGA